VSAGEAAWLAAVVSGLGAAVSGEGVLRGIGDDAAVLALPAGESLIATVDMVVEGQHFERRGPRAATPADIGWRALAVSQSDIAAMGGRPLWALSSLGVPDGMTAAEVEALCAGLAEAAAAYGTAVVGGNLARNPERLVLDVTVLGAARRPLSRAGARPGDLVGVTGRLGAAAAGLALLRGGERLRAACGAAAGECLQAQRRPQPRVAEGLALGALGPQGVRAMCDVSDGLAIDLARLCGGTLGAVLWREALPVPAAVRAAAACAGEDALQWALHGGEDYELLCAVAPEAASAAPRAVARAGGALHLIGEFTATPGELRLAARRGGRGGPLPASGWDPFA